MGIAGQWELIHDAISPLETTLLREGQKHLAQTGKPLRVAVDASILLWKMICGTNKDIASGINHASKDFMYHVCHDLRAGLQAIYVFDGPGRPLVKRGKARLRPNPSARPPPPPTSPEEQHKLEDNLDHVTTLAKQLLDRLNIPRHDAPGEAEAECVELEKARLVDAVVTTDGDTLAFGGQRILRYRSRNMKDGMHMVTAAELKQSGRDRGSWILLALLSGGDYSDGVYGCRDAFAKAILQLADIPGSSVKVLCSILRSNQSREGHRGMLNGWRSKFLDNFRQQVKSISANVSCNIANDFPNERVVNFYLHPVVSSPEMITQLAARPLWQQAASVQQLRDFAAVAFDWQGRSRAKQFLHSLAPGLLAQQLLIAGCQQRDISSLFQPNKSPQRFTGKASEDVPMAKIWYQALKVAPIDYSSEHDMPTYRPWKHGVGDKHDPYAAYETKLPEFLLEFGAPSSAIPATAASAKKRKTGGTGDEDARSSKKAKPKPPAASSSTAPADPRTAENEASQTRGFQRLKPATASTPIYKYKERVGGVASLPWGTRREATSSKSLVVNPEGNAPLTTISPNVISSGSSIECIDLTDV